MTDYMTTREGYGGRTETIVDTARFVVDLAAALGGTVEQSDPPDNDYHHILVGELRLSVYANGFRHKGKVHVTCYPVSVPHEDRPYHDGKGTYEMPDANISPLRPMPTIAKDVQRRVIDAAQEPLASIRAYVAKRQASRGSLAENVAKIVAAVPELRESQNGSSSEDSYSKTLNWNGGGVYLSARAYNDGKVGIDRIGSVSLEVFLEICAVLRGGQ